MKTKQLLLIIALIVSVSSFKAQNKYEFMTIAYCEFDLEITISINGKDYIKSDARRKMDDKSSQGANFLLKKVEEYQDLDWELINFETESHQLGGELKKTHYAYLRKKKADKK